MQAQDLGTRFGAPQSRCLPFSKLRGTSEHACILLQRQVYIARQSADNVSSLKRVEPPRAASKASLAGLGMQRRLPIRGRA